MNIGGGSQDGVNIGGGSQEGSEYRRGPGGGVCVNIGGGVTRRE